MFATMRSKSRNRRMKNELGQSVDHFKRAASLAAQETSATVRPTLDAAVGRVQPAAVKAKGVASSGWDSALATLTPLVTAATDNVRQTSKTTKKVAKKADKKADKQNRKNAQQLEKRVNKALSRTQGRSKSRLFGWALLGTAVGVGAAYAAKRRKAAQWDEYDPATPVAPAPVVVTEVADDASFGPTEPQAYTTPNGTQNPR